MENGIIVLILLIALATAAITDLLTGKVSNWITLPTTATGLVFHAAMNGTNGLSYSAKGLGVGFGLLILFYASGGFGAGDVKLVAATGSLLGPSEVLSAVWAATFIGGLFAMSLLIIRLGWGGMVRWTWSWLKSLVLLGGEPPALPTKGNRLVVRYAPVFAIGTLVSLALSYIE